MHKDKTLFRELSIESADHVQGGATTLCKNKQKQLARSLGRLGGFGWGGGAGVK